ncbi:MAG: stage II sporulation protein R [Firmicutes bacterium]|nr:stage II sporulation protein R [Bacillota bacterium]
MKNKLKKWEIALLIALCVTLLTGVWAGGQSAALSDKLIRLHVIANSDTDADQSIKLAVRDKVLALLTPQLDGVKTVSEAQTVIEAALPDIVTAAREVAGQDVPVSAEIGQENYPTREYPTFSLPAGEYTSLRVTLGSGQGHNWWCVIFPPLCDEAASGSTDALSALDKSDVALLQEDSNGYVIKFKLLELWGEARNTLEKLFGAGK